MLCLVPALRALRRGAGDAHVALVGLPSAGWLVDRFPAYVDELVPFPGWPGIPEAWTGPRALPSFFAAMQARELDLAVQAQGGGLMSNPLTVMLGAARTGGYHLPGQFVPDPASYLEWDDYEPEPLRWARLVEHLGFPCSDADLELPVRDDDREELASAWPGRDGDYVVLHPGASIETRRWPTQDFAAVGDALAADGLDVVLTGVTGDAPLTGAVASSMRAPAADLAGRLSLGGLAAVVEGARLVVTNDTGTSHVAAAVGTPSVVVFRGSDPQRWAPVDGDRHRVVGLDEPAVAEQLARRGRGRCLGAGCIALGYDASAVPPPTVGPEQVLAAAAPLLAHGGAGEGVGAAPVQQ